MKILLLTVLGSLALAVFFVVAFCFERLSRKGRSQWQRDSLLPLDDDGKDHTKEASLSSKPPINP